MLTGAPEGAPRKAAIKRHSRHLISKDRLLNPIAELSDQRSLVSGIHAHKGSGFSRKVRTREREIPEG